MIMSLFRKRRTDAHGPGEPRTTAARPAAPPDTRIYAVGDIHGRADLLATLHGMIREDAAGAACARRLVVYLGDYVDRGPDSRRVVEMLVDEPLDGFEQVYLRGNHDAWLTDFLADEQVGPVWMFNGGNATLLSYGAGQTGTTHGKGRITALQEQLVTNLPAAHLAFFRNLRDWHAEGDYFFVHAGVRPGVPLDRQSEQDMLWIRDEFLHSDHDFGKVIVHGHTIVHEPEITPHRIDVDTGAFASGRLTCLVLDGTERWFLQT